MTDALNEDQKARILAAIPAGRLGQSDEIAAAVVYLASAGGRLRHRPDLARQRRHGHDLIALFGEDPGSGQSRANYVK